MNDNYSDWRVVDICCGIGGISFAAEQLGVHVAIGLDSSASALSTFSRNFPNASVLEGSVTSKSTIGRLSSLCDTIDKRQMLLVSGPPCQGFSSAGPRRKFDSRNRILAAVAGYIDFLQPACALIENVSNLMSDRHRHTLKRFERKLHDAGYNTLLLQLDASEFGVPQKRKRMFCFASKSRMEEQTILSSLADDYMPPKNVQDAFAGLRRPIIYAGPDSLEQASPANHIAMRHSREVQKKIASIAIGKGPMSYRKLDPNSVARTLVSGHRAPPAHYKEHRSITPREAARLQGFPDTFEIHCSFSYQLLHIANAVPPPLAKAAVKAILNACQGSNKEE